MKSFVYSYIETLLIEEKFISPQDLDTAHQEVSEIKKKASMPLCVILAREHNLSEQNILSILNSENLYNLSLEIIYSSRDIKSQDIKFLAKLHTTPADLIKDIYNKKIISKHQRQQLINTILNLKQAGKQALKNNFITEDQLENALKKQSLKKSVSEILYEKHLITLFELNHIFRKLDGSLKLGEILLSLDIINRKTLRQALDNQQKTKISLGTLLIQNNEISINQLYFGLSIQYNVPFRALTNFSYNDNLIKDLKSIVTRQYAEENLIIPLLLTGSNLTLGVYNPSHLASTNDIMAKYKNLNINCVLITHKKFEQLYAQLYQEILNTENDLIKIKSPYLFMETQKMVISEPDYQYRLINDFYDKYLQLCHDQNSQKLIPKRELFQEFISENFINICKNFDCTHVSFWFNVLDSETEIKASPILSDI